MKINVEFQEPDGKKKIKRIIAREGLILLGIILLTVILALPEAPYDFNFFFFFFPLCISYVIIRCIFWGIRRFNFKIGWFYSSGIIVASIFLLFLYLDRGGEHLKFLSSKTAALPLTVAFLYACLFVLVLIIRFIVWAIKTLKEK